MQRSHRVRGFTLIELLVTIGIIGLLVALLLPSVQQAREAARRTSCKNKLRQIGTALHNYHDAHGMLPISDSVNLQRSWLVMILPQLEETSRYNQMDFSKPGLDGMPNGPAPGAVSNLSLIQESLPVLLCPSDPEAEGTRAGRLPVDASNQIPLAMSSYSSSVGDHNNDTAGYGEDPPFGNEATTGDVLRGVIGRFAWSARFGDVVDGLSNTFFVGEVIPIQCDWHDWGYQTFATTALPINYRINNPTPSIPDTCIAFRSRHPAGAHFLLGDNRVRFLNENMDLVTYRALASRAGTEVIDGF